MNQTKKTTRILWLVVLVLAVVIFRQWFGMGVISSGDLEFFYPPKLREYFLSPPLSWETFRGFGLGGNAVLFQGSFYYNFFLGILGQFFNFNMIERILWFLPLILLSFMAVFFLQKSIDILSLEFLPFTFLILFLNTYFLMIVSGGQITVALAYALFPLAVGLFFRCIRKNSPKITEKIWFFLILAMMFAIDFRFAYIFFLFLGTYFLYHLLSYFPSFAKKNGLIDFVKKYLKITITAVIVLFGLNLFWLLPLFLFAGTSLPAEYAQEGWVEFLSFANFSDSFSLLHPNWPEGIFGKTYFMRPEFLLLPVLAFSSLLFLKNPESETRSLKQTQNSKLKTQNKISKSLPVRQAGLNFSISYFALLGLIGAFLAKGSKPPFGGIYLWLFNHFPGFNMFRDPTKFYVLVALSYSILIPLSLERLTLLIKRKWPKSSITNYSLLVTFLIFWLFLIRPAWLGQLGGTLKAKQVPPEYIALKEFIHGQGGFFRTFWVPKRERFGFHSSAHPAVSAESLITDSVCQEPFCSLKTEMPEKWGQRCFPNDRCYVRELSYFLNPKTEEILRQMAVKLVIIPFDSQQELFIAERKYNPQQREEAETFLDTIPWLKKIDIKDPSEVADGGRTPRMVEGIAVYEVKDPEDRFFVLGEVRPAIDWEMINPTKYQVQIKNAMQPFELIFSETYDELWQAKIGKKTIPSKKFGHLNSFLIDQTGDFEVSVEFKPQRYVYFGLMVSLSSLFILLLAV